MIICFEVQTYFGCENLKIPSLKKDTVSASTTSTNITFSNLTSYARYVGKITAYTFYRGLETQVEFSTNQSGKRNTLFLTNFKFFCCKDKPFTFRHSECSVQQFKISKLYIDMGCPDRLHYHFRPYHRKDSGHWY